MGEAERNREEKGERERKRLFVKMLKLLHVYPWRSGPGKGAECTL